MQVFIRVNNLRQRFGSQEVLKGVSFEIPTGSLTALIGGSGAGKSVILKHLDGLLDPIGGSVEINGRRMSGVPEKEKRELRRLIGFMFQQGALFDSMNVGENVSFPLREQGNLSETEISRRMKEALSSVGLQGQEDKMPSQLSGGMIKRVAVARAIIMKPACLLYDEPTAGLDPIVTDSISTLIRQICTDQGITSVIVSHDMPSILRIADQIIFLKDGTVYWTGTSEELLRTEDPFLQRFLYGDSGNESNAVSQFRTDLLERATERRIEYTHSQDL